MNTELPPSLQQIASCLSGYDPNALPVATAQEFPTFTYTVDMVEVLGRELNLAVTGQKDPKEALDLAAEEFNKLAAKDGLLKE